MNKILTSLIVAGAILAGSNVNAANMENKNMPLSKVSDVKNMNDDTVVYIQGFLVQNLGDEMYVFQDDSGTINVEIDDDLMQNAIAPDTIVWIAATVDNENGEPVTLEAEEIQLLPATTAQPMTMSSKTTK